MPAVTLRLGRHAKNLMLSRIEAGAATGSVEVYREPLPILLMPGGNRPRRGYFLKEGERRLDRTDSFYVEMPPDPVAFETIFSRECGHLIDDWLDRADFARRPSRFVHTAPALTDYETAFGEGFGIHFETMTVDRAPSAEVRALEAPR